MEDVRYIALSIAEIVDGVLLHAQRMLDDETYDWPTSRVALERILADLEAQSTGDPGIERLRGFIATGEEVWKIRQRSVWWFRRRARFGPINRSDWWRR
jgi:hypothetical protein